MPVPLITTPEVYFFSFVTHGQTVSNKIFKLPTSIKTKNIMDKQVESTLTTFFNQFGNSFKPISVPGGNVLAADFTPPTPFGTPS